MHWLSWHDGDVKMGDGVVYGDSEFLNHRPYNVAVNFQTISMATPRAKGVIFFRDDSGNKKICSSCSIFWGQELNK